MWIQCWLHHCIVCLEVICVGGGVVWSRLLAISLSSLPVYRDLLWLLHDCWLTAFIAVSLNAFCIKNYAMLSLLWMILESQRLQSIDVQSLLHPFQKLLSSSGPNRMAKSMFLSSKWTNQCLWLGLLPLHVTMMCLSQWWCSRSCIDIDISQVVERQASRWQKEVNIPRLHLQQMLLLLLLLQQKHLLQVKSRFISMHNSSSFV